MLWVVFFLNNGLCIQYGIAYGDSSNKRTTLPIAYTTKIFSVTTAPRVTGTFWQTPACVYYTTSLTTISTGVYAGASALRMYFMAIGY